MGTTTNHELDKRLHQLIGDWIEEDLTTAATASSAVISTNLNKWDDGRDDRFNGWWVYFTDEANVGVERQIFDYVTSGGSCLVRGGNLAEDASTLYATCRFYKYSYAMGQRALQDTAREIYPVLFRPLEDRTLVTGNILPDNSFELWTAASTMSLYSASSAATLTRTTTTGAIRGPMATTSMKVAAGADDGDQYAYIDSDTFPHLLDLKGTDIDMAVWAKASSTDDAFMDVVSTIAGATSTVSITCGCTKDVFGLIHRENIAVSTGITKVEFRFRVHTKSEDAYFDSARVNGRSLREYMLLSDFADGEADQVYIQTTGYSDDICDDLHPRDWQRIYGCTTYNDGTYQWLRLPAIYSDKRQIRVIGTAPLSAATTYTDSVEIDGGEADLFVNYAAYCLFRNEEGVPSSEDTGRYTSRAYKYLREYERLKPSHRMIKPEATMTLQRAY